MKTITLIFSIIVLTHASMNKELHQKCATESHQLAQCCDLPKPEAAASPECQHHLDVAVKSQDHKEKLDGLVCFEECFFKTNGLIDEKSSILKEKVFEFYDSKFKEYTDLVEVFKNGTDFCIENVLKSYNPEKAKENGKCSRSASLFNMCGMNYLIKNCPEAKQVKSPECDKVRANPMSFDECMKNHVHN